MLFLDNKYTKWYFGIIKNFKNSKNIKIQYETEEHHIVPKSLGGLNDKSNLVHLTHREHFICHWLLIKMTAGEAKRSMCFALSSMRLMTNKHSRTYSSWQYMKIANVKAKIGKPRSEKTKQKISEAHTGKLKPWVSARNKLGQSDETKLKISQNHHDVSGENNPMFGQVHSKETRLKMQKNSVNKNKGLKRSEETKMKMSLARKKYWEGKHVA